MGSDLTTAAVDPSSSLERLIRRDRLVVALALTGVTLLAWIYLVRMAAAMHAAASEAEMHAAMGMTSMTAWSAADVVALFVMWAVMMAGMMLPSAAPMILLVIGTYRRRGGRNATTVTFALAGGYLVAWTGFSLVAALLQAVLHAAALMSSAMVTKSTVLAGAIFLAAGTYQWLPVKHACLMHCRSPLHFLTDEWREGVYGAFRLGLRHGLFCIGCCWVLMAVLFAAGVMNLLWVAAIAVLVLLERALRQGPVVGRLAGLLLVAWGVYLLTLGA